MRTNFCRLLAVVALTTLLLPLTALADGFIVVPDHPGIRPPPPWPPPPPPPQPWPRPMPPPRPHPVYMPLEVSYHHVEVKIENQVARTEVDQEFYNPTGWRLEGYYMFPLPKGAQIDKFSMWIDGKEMQAELLPAEKARAIYEDIVRRARDPALLEYVGRDMFRAKIFPIEPRSNKRVKIAYTQLLKAEGNTVSYLYPLNTEKFSAKPLRNVSMRVEINSKEPIINIYSPTHNVDIRRRGDHYATVGFEEKDTRPDIDFQLFFSRDQKDVGISLVTYRPVAGEDGYFMLLASPRVEYSKTSVSEKDVVFVADTSGSMAGPKLDQLKRALQYCIGNLNDGDRFEVVRFSTEADPLFNELRRADKASLAKAHEYVEKFRAAGGTAIDDALQTALKLKPKDSTRPFIVVFLTDGRPTIGETNEDKILANIRRTDPVTRIFTFGIGTDLNTTLLDRITEETKAASQYVLPQEDIEVKVTSFFDKISLPVITNVELNISGNVRVSKLYPHAIPDLFKGEQVVVFGRYSGAGDAPITITGYVNGKPQRFTFEDRFDKHSDEHPFIARLWATRRVGYLLDEVRLRGESQELKDEIIALAREHGIVTPYTSYLIVEDERRRVAENRLRPEMQTLGGLGMRGLAETDDAIREEAQKEAERQWRSFANAKAGGVGGWRDTFASDAANQLKNAYNIPQYAAQRAQAAPSAPVWFAERRGSSPLPGEQQQQQPQAQQLQAAADLSRYFKRLGGKDTESGAPVAIDLSQQVRNIGAKTFYQNGLNWIDSEVQRRPNAKRVQVVFGSKEYFELLAKIPGAAAWLALGQNVSFAYGDAVYEIIPPAEGDKTH